MGLDTLAALGYDGPMGRLCILALGFAALTLAIAACDDETSVVPPDAWDGTFDTPVARPEHPRPDLWRDTFINLNTVWQFAFDPGDVGLDEDWVNRDDVWDDEIQVPYAWEAPLSGLGEIPENYSPMYTAMATTHRGVAWYRLQLPGHLPQGDDWYLVFGAVDFEATVWVDGTEVGSHRGGYAPFSVNLSSAATGDEPPVIVVRAVDLTELSDRAQPVGKQGGTWYTRISGIWQTVYLEQRPAVHVTDLRVVPDAPGGAVTVQASFEGAADVRVRAYLGDDRVGEVSAQGAAVEIAVPLDEVQLWGPGHPTLYDLEVTVTSDAGVDVVHSYFGLADPGRAWLPGRSPDDSDEPLEQAQSFTAHGEPVYLRCVLDQSYWPDGLYTAPSLDAIRGDLELARDFGFNCIRLHIKPDEPVKLRLIDEMGFYLVYDIPCLDMAAENTSDFIGREYFAETLTQVVQRDASHPSLMLWVVFNENWGLSANGSLISPDPLADDPDMQQWVADMVDLTRTLDPHHPVEDNSAGGVVGVYEHVTGDSNSFHHYEEDAAAWREVLEAEAAVTYPGSAANYVGGAAQDGAPWWNSEFASFSFLGSSEDAYCNLFGALNELRRIPRLSGWVLTQLTDLEFEDNGLVSYDREAKGDLCTRYDVSLADVLGDDFVGFEWLPGEVLEAGATVDVPLWFSQWSSAAAEELTLSLRWDDGPWTEATFTPEPWEVSSIEGIEATAPADPGAYTLVVKVQRDSERVCANRLDVEVQ
jgi:hypothetical protein